MNRTNKKKRFYEATDETLHTQLVISMARYQKSAFSLNATAHNNNNNNNSSHNIYRDNRQKNLNPTHSQKLATPPLNTATKNDDNNNNDAKIYIGYAI